MVTEVASLIVKADSSQVVQTEKNLKRLNATGKKTDAQLKSTNKNFAFAKNGMQQVGFQVQDIAVQLSGGQSPFVVLAQQGSQLASIMGPGGALLGAVIAIGGAISGALLPNLFKASESTQDYIDNIEELTDGFKDVTDAQRIFINQTKEVERQALQENIKQITQEIENMQKAIIGSGELLPELLNADEVQIFNEAVDEAVVSITRLNSDLDTEKQKLAQLGDFIDRVNGKHTEAKDKVQALVAVLKQEADTYGKTALEVDIYKAAKLGATQAQLDAIRGHHETIELIKSEDEARKAAKESLLEEIRLEKEAMEAKDKAREQAITIIDRYSLSVLQGEARVRESYNRQITDVRQAMADNAEIQQQGADLIVEIEKRKAADIEKIRADEANRRKTSNAAHITGMADLLATFAALSDSENKKSFKRSQNLAIAAATIKGVQATINAYEEGTKTSIYLGAAYAAIAAATTGAQIAQIRNQKAPRQQGGQMLANNQYLVGEQGPEIVSVGGSGGFVSQVPSQQSPDVKITVNNINNSSNTVSNATVRQISDRDFVVQVITEEMSDSTSRTRRGLHSTSNVKAKAL